MFGIRHAIEIAGYFVLLVGHKPEQGSYDHNTLSKPAMSEQTHHALRRTSWHRHHGICIPLDPQKRWDLPLLDRNCTSASALRYLVKNDQRIHRSVVHIVHSSTDTLLPLSHPLERVGAGQDGEKQGLLARQ